MRRVIAIILALLMILPILGGCGSNEQQENIPTAEGTSEQSEVKFLDDLPAKDFGGEVVKVLTWTEQTPWDWTEEVRQGEVIDTALFKRQESVSDRFNVDFELVKRDGAWAYRESYVNTIRLSIEGDQGFDIIASHPSSAAAASVAGYLKDLNALNYIDQSKSYWPEDIWNTLEISEKLYFTTGDITSSAIRSISCMILNLDIYNSLNYEKSIYDIINDQEWTYEKMLEISVGILDADKMAITVGANVEFDNLFYGAGFRYVEYDPTDEMLAISSQVSGEQLGNFFGNVQKLFKDNVDVMIAPIDAFFTAGQSMWFMGYLSDVQTYLLDVTFDFAIAPYPKLDESQKEYSTVNGWWLSMYSVPTNIRSDELSGMIIEALASEGARLVTPAVYEASFELRYLRTEKNAIVFDLLHDTLVFDAGRIFCDQLDKIGYAFRKASDPAESWTTIVGSNSSAWERALRSVLRAFA